MRSQSLRVAFLLAAVLLFTASANADNLTVGSISFSASGPGSVSVVDPTTFTFSVSQAGGYLFIQQPTSPFAMCYVTTVTVDSSFLFSQSSCSGIGGGTGANLGGGNHTATAAIQITLGQTTFALGNGSIFIADSSTYNFTFGLGTHSLDITGQIVNPVPEPGTLALMGTGLVTVWTSRRKWIHKMR